MVNESETEFTGKPPSGFERGQADERVKEYEKSTKIKPLPGTRVYETKGFQPELIIWHRSIRDVFGEELIAYEWAPDYVGMSRVAVRKRVKKGQLTVFSFRMEAMVTGLFSETERERMRKSYRLVPTSELDVWVLDRLKSYHRDDFIRLRSEHVPGWWNTPYFLEGFGIEAAESQGGDDEKEEEPE